MGVTVHLACNGCDATADSGAVRRHYLIRGDRIYAKVQDSIEDVSPEGWVPFDPYTHATYCPTCWASITEPEATR